MQDQTKWRREEIEQLVALSERELREARGSAALGGCSRTVLLNLERQLRDGKKRLALLDSQLAKSSPSP